MIAVIYIAYLFLNIGWIALHSRNAHKGNYPLEALCTASPSLSAYIINSPRGGNTLDFANPHAVKALNAALLTYYYNLSFWDIPQNYLCPPVPGRADYIHYIADLLSDGQPSYIPKGKQVKGLDIGTGANLIYPIIAHAEYGWKMVGTDIDRVSIKSANTILGANPRFAKHIKVLFQNNENSIFEGVVKPNDNYDFCMCNPPFHENAKQALQSATRKTNNLARNKLRRQSPVKNTSGKQLNFAGQANELWCKGGELAFITSIINESVQYANQIKWFTSLVSKRENLPLLKKRLAIINATTIKQVDMTQGNKTSRFIAWQF